MDVPLSTPSVWRARPPPRANALPKAPEYYIDYTDSHLPKPARGPVGGSDKCLYAEGPDLSGVDPGHLSEPTRSIQSPAQADFLSGRWVCGIVLPRFLPFSDFPARSSS